jgi:hypothetical protein
VRNKERGAYAITNWENLDRHIDIGIMRNGKGANHYGREHFGRSRAIHDSAG